MSSHRKNLEYEHMKAKAPGILAEMTQMLIAWRKMGYMVPRGVKNVFEFTWEELAVSLPRKSFSGIYCPMVKFASCEDNSMSSSAATAKPQKSAVRIAGIKPTYVSPSVVDGQQQMLLRFQQRSVHLLSELLKMKMKIMIDAVAGPTAEEITRRFLESSQQLRPKSREEALDIMIKDPRRKGGRYLGPIVPAIPITSTTQLIQQSSNNCICFSLALKDSKQIKAEIPLSALDRSTRHSISKSKGSQDIAPVDPCPQAREMLREICQRIEAEKAVFKTKGYTRPLMLRHYPTPVKTYSAAMKGGLSPAGTAEPKLHKKSKKFHYAFPDGSSLIFYPSGNIAIYQFPICCLRKTITLLFHDARGSGLLGTFVSHGQSCVHYTTKSRCSIALLMTQEGGVVGDKHGVLTHQWSWHSKQQILQSLDFQINEQVKLKVTNLYSMALGFTSHNETISIPLSNDQCPHESKTEKQVITKTCENEPGSQWTRILLDSKRRFERIVKQFVNAVLMTAGICCIDYPFGESSKQVKFRMRQPSLFPTWEWRLREENSTLSEAERKQRAKAPVICSLLSCKTNEKLKLPSRDKAEADGKTQAGDTWATSLADCPVVLRKIMGKEYDGRSCRCVVKMPSITDSEFEKFVAAPREPHQILVICVLSSQNPSYSPFFAWSLEKMYTEMQHGRPSPCVQCKHDSFRLLKYDLDSPMNKKPPVLIQKHGVIPGMVVMYSEGKPVFGGCVFNGYSYSKKDFLKQIHQARLDCEKGYFLPQSFKFSSPGALRAGILQVQASASKPTIEISAVQSESKKVSSMLLTESRDREPSVDEDFLVDEIKAEEQKPKRATSGRKKTKK